MDSTLDRHQLWQLFKTFSLIGAFTFGGGHAMLQLIREEIVSKHKWMTDEEFIDLFAVAQSLPGVFAVNISIFVGYRLQGFWGACVCALGTTLPSMLIILIIAMYLTQFRENPYVEKVFKGIRPAVVALIAAPVVNTWKTMKLGWKKVWIPALSAILIWHWGINPVTIIIIAGLLGWLYVTFIKKQITHQNK
ncbi:chromate transporter [Porphyromonas cangingivalis]|uniref:chromate transporter n=1 Tax=Porphyromonas cangingivalis TaxID=36874 RepID=UPI00068F035B|nr:chromate transporter [Porphyromonas cangingivalis]